MKDQFAIGLSALCSGLVFGFLIGTLVVMNASQKEAVAHGAAHYDWNTAAFTWNNPATKE